MSRSKKKNRWKTIRLVLLYIISSSQATVKIPFTVSSVSSKVLAWFDAPFRLPSIIIRGFPHVPRAQQRRPKRNSFLSANHFFISRGFRTDNWSRNHFYRRGFENFWFLFRNVNYLLLFLLLLFLRLLLAGIMLRHFRFLVSAFNDFRESAGSVVGIVILCNMISD